jgi:hypothetical protein
MHMIARYCGERLGRVFPTIVSLKKQGPAFVSESNDFRRQRLSDFLAARLKPGRGSAADAQKIVPCSGPTSPPVSAENSRHAANVNDKSLRETSLGTRTQYPITGLGTSN